MTPFERLDAMFGCDGVDSSYECTVCRTEYYGDEDEPIMLDGEKVCADCRKMCPGCMEYITDETIKMYGVIVKWRDYIFDGKLVTMHCDCAVATFLTYLNPKFDDDYTTREEIAATVERHTAKAVAS